MTVSVSIRKGNDDSPPAATSESKSGMSSSASASSNMFFNRNGRGRGGSKSKNSNNNTGISSAEAASSSSRSRGVWLGRCLFLGCLAVVAIVLCYLANHIATGSEKELSERQFDSISENALSLSQNIADRKLRAAETMASIASFAHPNSNDWPYVIVDGYETISQELIVMSSGRGMALAPFVQPSIVDEFSDWAYHYMETTYPESKDTLGTFSFGKGIAATDPSLGTEDGKYPADKDGSVRGFDSPNKFFAPVLQHNKGPDGPLMNSMRHDPLRGTFMDQMIACSKEKATNKSIIINNNTNATSMPNHPHCGGLTDMMFGQNEPGGMIIKPIYPANDADTLVGVIVSSILWRNTIEGVFSNEVRGIDCVLESDSHIYTYEIINGIATLKGRGDLHDTKYDQYAKSAKLGGDCKTNANYSANYTLTLYPNKELFDVYSTNNPAVAIVGVVITILVISIVFFLYDSCVRQDINEKRAVMEAKRLFVRYVSHEVRTPLNAACMGTRLIQDEIKRVLTSSIDNDEQEQQSSLKDSMMQLPATATTNEEDDEKEEEQQQQQQKQKQRQSPLGSFAKYIQGLLQEVSDNVESAVDILNDLLHYDKIKTGRMKLELSKIPIFDVIEKTVTEFKLSAASKNIHVELDFHSLVNIENSSSTSEEECDDHDDEEKAMTTKSIHAYELPESVQQYRIIGDTIRITQALRNLLSNAMKFTPESGIITVAVSMTLFHDDDVKHENAFELNNGEMVSATKAGNLRIQVTDTGAGMTQDQLDQLFHDGVQFNVNQLQAGQGSGLGLCITKGIVEQHCGSLSAESDGLNMGATFTAELPMYKTADKKEVNPSERTATTMTPMEHCVDSVDVRPLSPISDSSCLPPNKQLPLIEPENLHILVVDDSLTNRKLLVRLLKNRGHSCEEAKDGIEALEQVKECIKEGRFFDTILLDYEMPGKDGPTASKEMRELGCDSFIVGITGNVLPEDVAYFKQKGANTVLPKPIHMETLESAWMEFGIFGRDPGKGETA